MILGESIKLKIGFRLSVLMALAVAVICALSQSAFAQQGGAANYFYDANGRLKAVLSPTGEAAIYAYDPAGNFTSITRRAANELSIIEFTPGAGGIGAQVIIYGTGFNVTPSANTVKFNGVTATVSAATKIQLTVNVPAGATTGLINVSNANGSVNSGGNFFVSGNVEFSIPINFGGAFYPFAFNPILPLTNVGMLTFDGVAGQRVSLIIDSWMCGTNSTPPPFSYAQISLISPSGAVVTTLPMEDHFDAGQVYPSPFAYIDALVLPATGRYTVLIDPRDSLGREECGGMIRGFGAAARLYDVPPDITGTISASGLPTPVNFDAPGQKMTLTFSGLSGQRLALRGLQRGLTLGYPTDIKLFSPGTYPNGAPLFSDGLVLDSFMDTTTLTASGTYTILADPAFNKEFGATLTLYEVPPDATGPITINGPAVPLNLTPGQNALLTFSVPSTQTVRVDAGNGLGGDNPKNLTVTLLRSDNSVVASATSSSFLVVVQQSLTPGTYKIKIDPFRGNAGSVNVSAFNP